MKHLLIVAPNWLGDAVMALPAIADIRRGEPDASITIAAPPSIAPLFDLVNGVRACRCEPSVLGRFVGTTPGSVFDAALLLPNSFHSAVAVFRAGIPKRWGYRTDWRGPLLTRAVPRPHRPSQGLHQVEYYQRLVQALGFVNGPNDPRLEVNDTVRTAGADALARAGWGGRSPVVALAPGAAYGGAKRWPPEYFADLTLALARDGVATAMVGSGADAPTGKEIEARLRGQNGRSRTLNLIGATDLPTLAGVLVVCRALVTNDSGAMHLAAALGVRVTAVFGPTNEYETGPRGWVRLTPDMTYETRASAHAVLANPVACRPCMLRECPIDHRCMRGVGVDRVLAEARRML